MQFKCVIKFTLVSGSLIYYSQRSVSVPKIRSLKKKKFVCCQLGYISIFYLKVLLFINSLITYCFETSSSRVELVKLEWNLHSLCLIFSQSGTHICVSVCFAVSVVLYKNIFTEIFGCLFFTPILLFLLSPIAAFPSCLSLFIFYEKLHLTILSCSTLATGCTVYSGISHLGDSLFWRLLYFILD